MASTEHKIVRKAQALTELTRLSALLAEHLGIEVPEVSPTSRDTQLIEIMRIEAINELLGKMLTASGIDTNPESEDLSHETKAELLRLASERKVEVAKSATKAEIIKALET